MNIDDDFDLTPGIGDNKPPGILGTWQDAFDRLSKWLEKHPAVQNDEDAQEAKIQKDAAEAVLGELEDLRSKETTPLYRAWQDCLAKFKQPQEKMGSLTQELRRRMSIYAVAEDAKRKAAAEAARKAAAEAERIAREAVEKERDLIENASMGEVGVDVGGAIAATDEAMEALRQAERDKAMAKRNEDFRFTGGFSGRASGLRTKKTLHLDDAAKALAALGVTDDIREAILKSARAYKALHKKLPDGVSETEEKTI